MTAHEAAQTTLGFGIHSRTPLAEIPLDYLEWAARKAYSQEVRQRASMVYRNRMANGEALNRESNEGKVQLLNVGQKVYDSMLHASQHLKYPKITFNDGEGMRVQFYFSTSTGKVYVSNGTRDRRWRRTYAVVESNGTVTLVKPDEKVTAFLNLLVNAEAFASFAGSFGMKMGNCCFCMRELTDERSTSKGYGPICAQHYNLPWG